MKKHSERSASPSVGRSSRSSRLVALQAGCQRNAGSTANPLKPLDLDISERMYYCLLLIKIMVINHGRRKELKKEKKG